MDLGGGGELVLVGFERVAHGRVDLGEKALIIIDCFRIDCGGEFSDYCLV